MIGRNGEFAIGQTGSNDIATSLDMASIKQNSMNPHRFTPNSVIQQYMPSPNGNSATDAKRMFPGGMLPSSNGYSLDTYARQNPATFGTPLKI